MAISLRNQQSASPINERKLKRRLGKILKEIKLPEACLVVLLTGDEEIRRLNRDFRGADRPTNVLALPSAGPLREGAPDPIPFPNISPESAPGHYLGDIAVSLETVLRESEEGGEPAGFLLYFYLIHGLLHLTGYDHELGEAEDRA